MKNLIALLMGLLLAQLTLGQTTTTSMSLAPPQQATEMPAPASDYRAPERKFKKKILATAFAVNKNVQVDDLDAVGQNFPKELLHRLYLTQGFLIRLSPNVLSFNYETEAPSIQLLHQLGTQYDSQFVLSGTLIDANVVTEKKFWGLVENKKRHLILQVELHDVASGSLLGQHRLSQIVDQEILVGKDKPFASNAFFATPYGKAFDQLLEQATHMIVKDLEPIRFYAKIIQVNPDGEVMLDAGANSTVLPGDMFAVFGRQINLSAQGMAHTSIEHQERRLGTLAVIRSQKTLSVAELSADTKVSEVKVGDIVRVESLVGR
ncbi:hypothetical protein LPB67_16735 [Undibacterium sp. Jales W-56]|uniref:flagella assembly protein FlgT middle domain-containing protein n=1 Tax=Undibacterium sp. Jales W-56 TaxID=2897325 RepID=UPI0021D18277|nr:flagella assembly protein FlgT middle domain-containing protein [Undibacterium sp. Jales W-56]MCU6435425.1 hypothetical protein [Undibacterium sp. Jales W-56]